MRKRHMSFFSSGSPRWLLAALLVGFLSLLISPATQAAPADGATWTVRFTDQAARNEIWGTASFWVLWASIAGRLLAGYLADKFPRKYVMLVTYLVAAIAIPSLFLVHPDSQGYVYLFALVFGFAMGADYMLIPLMAADQFGLNSLARAMSAILPTDTIAQFWFPNLIERLRIVFFTGDYHAAMMAVFATAFIGAMAIAALPKKARIPKT